MVQNKAMDRLQNATFIHVFMVIIQKLNCDADY